MDEDSILFQAMKNEMYPQVDPAAMRFIDPGSEYDLGVEVRTRNPMNRGGGGSVANPLRMQRQPSDFAGRPAHANANPSDVGPNRGFGGAQGVQRPSGNVINNYRRQWQFEKNYNERDAAPIDPSATQKMMQWLRDFFNANRPPNSGLFD